MDMSFPGHSDGKASACNAGDLGSILGSERSPGEGNGYPPQYSCLENPMESPWQAAVHRVAQSWTRLKQLSTHARVNMACCVPFQISLSVFFRYRPRSRAVRSVAAECAIYVKSLNHPVTIPPPSTEKLSSTKLVPGAKKGWGPLQ